MRAAREKSRQRDGRSEYRRSVSGPSFPLHLYNTATGSSDLFEPLDGTTARVYYCGPTVYSQAHIGNMRAYLFSDILRRTLSLAGWQVEAVMNITDVGHLTGDSDDGADKMQESANKLKTTAWDIAERYTSIFFRDTGDLNIQEPQHVIRATDAIQEQIDLIAELEAKGVTYLTTDGLYFDTSKIDDYGKLTPTDSRDSVLAGNRVSLGDKRNPTDFALWKLSQPDGPKRDMEWESPWGLGFPGWHIECSAMAMAVHGPTLDIHVGGIDHVPIHHTNEIAQSETATGKPFSRWWMHCAFLTIGNDEKMAKSGANFITVDKLEEQGFEPLDFRYLSLTSHYRSELAFALDNLEAAATARKRLMRRVEELAKEAEPAATPDFADPFWTAFTSALGDDLNTAQALAAVWTFVRESELEAGQKLALLFAADQVLGLDLHEAQDATGDIPAEVTALAEERVNCRAAGDYARADEIRDELHGLGFEVVDGADGYTIRAL